ncbi:hypothetical protein D3C87_1897740 [compost metagenome]
MFEIGASRRDLGLVGIVAGRMLKANQVHGRALQFQFQRLVVQCHVEASRAVLVGTQAAVFVFVFVLVGMIMIFAGVARRQG